MSHKEQLIKELLEELRVRKTFGVSAFKNPAEFHDFHKAIKEIEEVIKNIKDK